jgi:hypothetical protein
MRFVKHFAPIALVVAFLTSCSSDDERVRQSEDILFGNSDVEVKLSSASGGGLTRASVESEDNGLFELDHIGIYMLGTFMQSTNPDERPIDWRLDYNRYASWITNVESQAVFNADTTRTDIRWKDGQTRWYPVGNWYSYRFYGYYPRVEDEVITTEEKRVTVNYYNLDGKTDIIWGRSACADPDDPKEMYRYSARYFRQMGYSEKYPEIAFQHKLMRIQFYIQGLSDPNLPEGHQFDPANEMIIDTIIVKDVPTVASLILADLDDNTNDGKMLYDWTSWLGDMGVVGENDGTFIKEQIQNDSLIKVGQPLLLPVPDAEAASVGYTKYGVEIRLRNLDGVLFDHEKPIELKRRDDVEFEAGKTYRVILKIAGPKQVSVRATLAPWEYEDDELNPLTIQPLTFD